MTKALHLVVTATGEDLGLYVGQFEGINNGAQIAYSEAAGGPVFYGYIPRLYFAAADCKGAAAIEFPNVLPLNPHNLVFWGPQTGTLLRMTGSAPETFRSQSLGSYSVEDSGFRCTAVGGEHQAAPFADTEIPARRYLLSELSVVLR